MLQKCYILLLVYSFTDKICHGRIWAHMGAHGRTWAHFSTFAKMRPGRILFLVYSHMRPGRILALLIKCAHVLKRAPGRILALLIKCAHSALGRIGRIWAHMGAIYQ